MFLTRDVNLSFLGYNPMVILESATNDDMINWGVTNALHRKYILEQIAQIHHMDRDNYGTVGENQGVIPAEFTGKTLQLMPVPSNSVRTT